MHKLSAILLAALILIATAGPALSQDPEPAQEAQPAKPIYKHQAVNLSGAWVAKANGSSMEAYIAQKGPFVAVLAYVTQPDGKVSVYHMGGTAEDGKVAIDHTSGYHFRGHIVGPDTLQGELTIKSYPIVIETTAHRRKDGKQHDPQAEAFFSQMLAVFPDPS